MAFQNLHSYIFRINVFQNLGNSSSTVTIGCLICLVICLIVRPQCKMIDSLVLSKNRMIRFCFQVLIFNFKSCRFWFRFNQFIWKFAYFVMIPISEYASVLILPQSSRSLQDPFPNCSCCLREVMSLLPAWTGYEHGVICELCTSWGRLNKKDGLSRYGDSHVKDKTS